MSSQDNQSLYTCTVCGKGYSSPSLGGPGICPSCDVGKGNLGTGTQSTQQDSECAYCQEPKLVRVWKQTGELVCFDCRQSLLEQEFNQ